MLLSSEKNYIQGVHQTPIISQHERQNELNSRIQSRQFPDHALEPQFSLRPVSTKYSFMGIVAKNSTLEPTCPIVPTKEYNGETDFTPSRGPWRSYVKNIDTEIMLRNQTFALQNASQSVYIPSSNSDLYKVQVPKGSQTESTPYENLFAQPSFDSAANNRWKSGTKIGIDRFNNSTRTQLRQAM
jgi:hypothetical protein